jgi:hypothetical protein
MRSITTKIINSIQDVGGARVRRKTYQINNRACPRDRDQDNMHEKISFVTRLKYVLIAILLLLIGLILLLTFFMMITIPFALAALAWSGIFIYLAAIGRPYGDFSASLRWHRL